MQKGLLENRARVVCWLLKAQAGATGLHSSVSAIGKVRLEAACCECLPNWSGPVSCVPKRPASEPPDVRICGKARETQPPSHGLAVSATQLERANVLPSLRCAEASNPQSLLPPARTRSKEDKTKRGESPAAVLPIRLPLSRARLKGKRREGERLRRRNSLILQRICIEGTREVVKFADPPNVSASL